MIRAGIIGLGRMGVSHCAIIKTLPDVEKVVACEPSNFVRTAVEKHSNIKCYKDHKEMIGSNHLDCVFITTPTKFHFEMVNHALLSNLNVFVEKPFCLTPNEGLLLVELAQKNKKVNQVGYHNRFIGTFRETKRIVDSSLIGEVYHVIGEAYGPVVLKEKGMTWRSETTEGGGCLYDYATHVINLMQFIVGNPTSISGAILKKIHSKKVDDAVYANLLFSNGISGQLSVNWSDETYRKMSTQISILGKKGKIVADAQELKVYFNEQPSDTRYERGWNTRWLTDLSPKIQYFLRGEEYSAQIEYFINCIKENSLENINSFKNAYETDIVVDGILRNTHKEK